MKIFFYCSPFISPEEARYQDLAVSLAEGLKQIGVDVYANTNYWQSLPENNKYLFKHESSVKPQNCDVIVMNHHWFLNGGRIPNDLFRQDRKYVTVYLDGTDDKNKSYSFNSEFRKFDLILKTHYSSKSEYPSNFYPWAFGLSQRMLKELKCVSLYTSRMQNISVSFRYNNNNCHSVRNIIPKLFLPKIKTIFPVDQIRDLGKIPSEPYENLMWNQTGRRHYSEYYKRLQKTSACAAFGGYFVSTLPRNPNNLESRLLRKIIGKLGLHSYRVIQWDSWRFWESLLAGCITFHLDFDKYGFVLPVNPRNYQHYIGVDLQDIDSIIIYLSSDPKILADISTQGRKWALENYRPEAVAMRFLKIVEHTKLGVAPVGMS